MFRIEQLHRACVTLPLLVFSVPAAAQNVVSARPGLIHFVAGEAALEGQPLVELRGLHVREGQRFVTGKGVAEVSLVPGVLLRLYEYSEIRMEPSVSATAARLMKGSIIVEVRGEASRSRTAVITGNTSVSFKKPGWYRIDRTDATSLLRVYRGKASVTSGQGELIVRAGKSLPLTAPLASTTSFDSTTRDAFHQWSELRSQAISQQERGLVVKGKASAAGHKPELSPDDKAHNQIFSRGALNELGRR